MSSFDDERVRRTKLAHTSASSAASPVVPAHTEINRTHGPVEPPANRGQIVALQRLAGNAAVSRLLAEEETEDVEQERSPVHDVVGRGGQALPESVRAPMESSFGQDFSSVRVHTDSSAAASARSVNAKAYTVGDDVVLGDSVPSLASEDGQRTLAHELTHVMQQRSGPVEGTPAPGGISISDPSDRFEHEADHVASQVMGSEPAAAAPAFTEAADTGPALQRESEEDEEEDEESAPAVQRQAEEEENEDEMEGA